MPSPRKLVRELIQTLRASASPIYALNADRELIFANPACEQWVGLGAAVLAGQTVGYYSAGAANDPARANKSNPDRDSAEVLALSPPPEAFDGHAASGVVLARRHDGSVARRLADFTPLLDDGGQFAGVIAVVGVEELPDDAPAGVSHSQPAGTSSSEAAHLHEQLQQFRLLNRSAYHGNRLVGTSPAMIRVRTQIHAASSGRINSWLHGPPGSGRSFAARAIHYGRTDGANLPLVLLDGAALTAEMAIGLLQSIALLSRQTRPTFLIRDIERLAAEVHQPLLRLLAERADSLHVLSISERSPDSLAADNALPPDLAALLSPLTIHLPRLAERKQDLPLLAQALVEAQNARHNRQFRGLSTAALDQLAVHNWPGNLDELAEVISEACQRARGPEIVPEDLPRKIFVSIQTARSGRPPEESIVLDTYLQGIERQLIERALKKSKGNKAKAARRLGLTRPKLYRRLVQLGMEVPSSPPPRKPRVPRPRPQVTEMELPEFVEEIPFEEADPE